MKPIIERFTGQRVILHVAPNWRIVGTIVSAQEDTVELADENGACIFVSLASIVAIEPYRVTGGSGHYI
jgi:hypothetical protein